MILTNNYPKYPKDNKYFHLVDLEHFHEVVVQWALDRNLLEGTTNLKQCKKFHEEKGEMLGNIIDGKDIRDDIGDCLVIIVQMIWREGSTLKLKSIVENCDLYGTNQSKLDGVDFYNTFACEAEALIDSTMRGFAVHYEWCVEELYLLARHFGFTLLECCEIAFNDIKDRKGKMINGSFVKEVKKRLFRS